MPASYLDYSGRDDVLDGGARRIVVRTPAGEHRVWVKRVGNNPRLRVLLLHGGPGATHEYLEACDSYLPAAGIEYYYYDQLGSGYSDQPDEPSSWEVDRFVDEVEQVRVALGELGISADASLAHWDRSEELHRIEVPTLVIGAQHDTMDPAHMRAMAGRLPAGRYLHCPDGSHMAMYDDQRAYFGGLTEFLLGLADGRS